MKVENTTKKRVLIVDGLNAFFRAYITDPTLTVNGDPIGGCMGFLKSLQKITREMGPLEKIIVVWDGEGGSTKRRLLHKDYKEGRKPILLNRNIDQGLSEEQEIENKKNQFIRLVEYLNNMPIIQFMYEQVEADDVISYLTRLPSLQGKIKIIVSSDKDFIQLCNEETLLLRPIQKQLLNVPRVVEMFGIHPRNFALARSIVGDASDNIKGIDGAGLKTVAKRFSFLKDEYPWSLQEFINHCRDVDKKLKLHEKIIENEDTLKLNWKLTSLGTARLSPQIIRGIKEVMDSFTPEFNKMEVIRLMVSDGLNDWNWTSLFNTFRTILFEAEGQASI